MWRPLVTGLAAAWAVLGAGAVVDAAPPDSAPPDSTPPDTVPDDQGAGDDTGTDTGTVTGGTDGDATPGTLPLIPVPTGCEAPPMPHIVFIGTVDDRDYRTVRFDIDQIRSGRPDPFAARGEIDVRYGLDAQYLDEGETYLVSAVVDPDLGLLVSRVTEPIEHFGGDEVIGVSETDVDCPEYEDPMRTLHVDGTPIDAGVLDPLLEARFSLLGAVLVPAAVAVGAIFLLAMFRLSLGGLYRSVTGTDRRT